jgi:uncharacterized protein (DUF1697 family)
MLRGVNVGGRGLAMADFSAALTGLGYDRVTTYVQSGNAVVRAPGTAKGVTTAVAGMLAEEFGLDVPVLVRSRTELTEVVAGNPFLDREDDPTKLHVTFLAVRPGASRIEPPAGTGRDTFEVAGREVYLHCPGGYGRTKLTNDFFERRLGVVATTRNWRSVVALSDLAAAATAPSDS